MKWRRSNLERSAIKGGFAENEHCASVTCLGCFAVFTPGSGSKRARGGVRGEYELIGGRAEGEHEKAGAG